MTSPNGLGVFSAKVWQTDHRFPVQVQIDSPKIRAPEDRCTRPAERYEFWRHFDLEIALRESPKRTRRGPRLLDPTPSSNGENCDARRSSGNATTPEGRIATSVAVLSLPGIDRYPGRGPNVFRLGADMVVGLSTNSLSSFRRYASDPRSHKFGRTRLRPPHR
jgi:hypothetical protein